MSDYATLFGISIAILGVCRFIDNVMLSTSTKKEIWQYLVNIRWDSILNKWATPLSSLINNLYGERHFSMKCIIRSAITSVLLLIIFLILHGIRTGNLKNNLTNFSQVILIVGLVINLIPDYLSLLKSRWLIKVAKKRQSLTANIVILISDILITLLIFTPFFLLMQQFVFAFFAYGSVATLDSNGVWQPLSEEERLIQARGFIDYMFGLPLISDLLTLKGMGGFLGIFFYTTFFTTLWIWLFIISALLIRLGRTINSAWSFISKKTKSKFQKNTTQVACFLLIVLFWIFYSLYHLITAMV